MKLGRILSLFFSKTKRRRHREWRRTSPRSPRRGGGAQPQGDPRRPHPLPLTSTRPNGDPELNGAAPVLPLPHTGPQTPTSSPTGPPTSCHCLGWNPSSAPAAWTAQPGWGAAGSRGRPLMPRRVEVPGLGAGLGPRASTAWACLSESSPLQKAGELIKNRWAGRRGSGCRPGPGPSSSQPTLSCRQLPPLALRAAAAVSLPPPPSPRRGIRLLQSMPRLHLPFQCPCRGLGWPPSLAQACKQTAEIWDVSPQKPAPDLL